MVYHHSWSAVAEGRAVAGRRAALEARRRASEMAAAVGGEVGPCLTLSEEACDHLALADGEEIGHPLSVMQAFSSTSPNIALCTMTVMQGTTVKTHRLPLLNLL